MIFLSTVDANYPSYKSLAQTSETGFQSYHWSKIETTESTARYTLYNRLTVGQTEIGQWWSIFLSQSTEMGFQPISLPVGKKNSKLWQMTISELRVLWGGRRRGYELAEKGSAVVCRLWNGHNMRSGTQFGVRLLTAISIKTHNSVTQHHYCLLDKLLSGR